MTVQTDTKSENNQLAECYLPAMMNICASYFSTLFRSKVEVRQATAKEDMKEATDLVVYTKKGPLRVACRVRRFEYFQLYSHELVLGSQNASGYPSELFKIVEQGLCDYYLYGWEAKNETHLVSWYLIRLDVFRRHLKYNTEDPEVEWHQVLGTKERVSYLRKLPIAQWKESDDKKGGLIRAFDLRTFPPEIFVNSYNYAMAPSKRHSALEWLTTDYPARLRKAPLITDWDMIKRLLALGATAVEVDSQEIRYIGDEWLTRVLYISLPTDPDKRLQVMMFIAKLYPEDLTIASHETVLTPEVPAPVVLKLTWDADAEF